MSLGSTNLISLLNRKRLLLSDLICQGAGNPLASHVVGTGVGGVLEDSSLSVLSAGDNLEQLETSHI